MELMHEELARAQMSVRLGEAQQSRRASQVAHARRVSRKAEKAARRQASLSLAQSEGAGGQSRRGGHLHPDRWVRNRMGSRVRRQQAPYPAPSSCPDPPVRRSLGA